MRYYAFTTGICTCNKILLVSYDITKHFWFLIEGVLFQYEKEEQQQNMTDLKLKNDRDRLQLGTYNIFSCKIPGFIHWIKVISSQAEINLMLNNYFFNPQSLLLK